MRSFLFLSLLACSLVTVSAKLLMVYLNESPLIETKAFKDIRKEVIMKRSVYNGNQRNIPLSELISTTKELKFQEKRIKTQQDTFISKIPKQWKIAEIPEENEKMHKIVSYLESNSVVIDIGESDVSDSIEKLMSIPGVKSVEEEHEIKFDTFQCLDQIGATFVYNAFEMNELDIGKGIKIAVTDNGNYVNTSMMNDGGFSLPTDIPDDRGEASNINNKLIISRAYGSHNNSYPTEIENNHGIQ